MEYAEKELADHYFRFEGRTHHAGEYQQYLEYMTRCLDSGVSPKPDALEGVGTVAILEAMEEACHSNRPVRVDEILGRYGLGA